MFNNFKSQNYTKKVSIIGMGYVGAGIAYALTIKNIAREIVFIDPRKEAINAEMLDIRHGIPNMGSPKITTGDYKDIKNSDLIIVTAGRNRKTGENRLDLIGDNIKIAENVAKNIKKYYNQGVVLVVANPVDIITYYLTKKLNLPKGKVFGTGCILDSSRLTNVISDYVGLGIEYINAGVIGEHGNSQIPLWSNVQVAQLPIEKYCQEIGLEFNDNIKTEMAKKVLNMGAEIIAGKGKTYYGISTCVCYLADAILNNKTISANVSSLLENKCGISNVALSLPSLINANGIKIILEPTLTYEEKNNLKASAETLSKILNYNIN